MDGCIYFIACAPMEAVKIGYTTHSPQTRLTNLQTGCPARLKLLSWVAGSRAQEKALHESFASLHIQGEWFRLEGKLKDLTYYLDGSDPNTSLENAVFDVILSGMHTPYDEMSEAAYDATASSAPIRKIWPHVFEEYESQ